jgi:hypothetical protein
MNTSDLSVSVSSFNQPSQEVQTPFFAVSVTKLVVLSFCTLGLYQIYWFFDILPAVNDGDSYCATHGFLPA